MGRVKDLLPDDWEGYDDFGDEPACDHDDYEVDWDGRATCDRCRESWWLTSEQLTQYEKSETRRLVEMSAEMRRLSEGAKTFRGLIAYCLVVYGPEACRNPYTRFGVWCLSYSGDWVYREERRHFAAEARDPLDDEMPF